ncbi:MAG: TolC family protein [Treponema sp.]|nr:TolC family protein [Treponema sp.]
MFLLITLAALVPALAHAETLSLEQARELALANSQSLKKHNLSVQSGVLDEKTQAYAGLPSLSLGASASATLWTNNGVPENLFKDTFGASASAGVSQKLWDGGKNSILKSIGSLSTAVARQNALAEYYTVLESADAAYYAVLEAAAALEAAESSLETAALSLSMAEIRRESGMLSDADYLQALAEKESRETARSQARRDLALGRLRLKNLTGLAETPELEPVDFAAMEPLIRTLAAMDDPGLDRLYGALKKQIEVRNPALAKAGLNSAIAEKNLSLAARDYSPTLSASLSTGLNYSVSGGLEPSAGRLSLSGSIPLDFWVTAANVEKRKLASEQAALDLRTAGESLDTEIQTGLLNLVSQAGQVLSSGRALDYAGKHFEYVLELYELSRNSLSELSDAEALVRSNRNQLIRSQYAFLSGLSALRTLGVFESEDEIAALVRAALGEVE